MTRLASFRGRSCYFPPTVACCQPSASIPPPNSQTSSRRKASVYFSCLPSEREVEEASSQEYFEKRGTESESLEQNAKHTSRQTALRLQRNGSPSVQNERSPMKRFGGNSLSLTHCKESRFLQRTRLEIRPVPVQFVKIVRRGKRYEQQNVREKKRRHSDQSQAIGI